MPEACAVALADPVAHDLIAVCVGGQDFCIDVRQVREIRAWSPVTRLPHSPPFVRGVLNLRGTVLPVVDLAARLGLAETDLASRPAVVVVWIDRKLVGLLVQEVFDIFRAPESALQPTPETGCAVIASLATHLVTFGDRLAGLLTLDGLLPDLEVAK
ncbi:MAG: chemotaxis protein CheW [Pseudomonadota bacterium]